MTKEEIADEFWKQQATQSQGTPNRRPSANGTGTRLEELLRRHRNTFVQMRYLENLGTEPVEFPAVQALVCALLTIVDRKDLLA